jgi:hypothetical protein
MIINESLITTKFGMLFDIAFFNPWNNPYNFSFFPFYFFRFSRGKIGPQHLDPFLKLLGSDLKK